MPSPVSTSGLRSEPLGTVFAVAIYLVAVGVRFLFGLQPGEYPFLTFFPAVILAAFLAGTRPAMLCAILSGLTAWYFYIRPFHSFQLEPSVAPALGLFAFISSVVIYIFDALTRTAEKLKAEQQVSLALIEQQRTMFAELQHRVANNLTFLSSLLILQKRQIGEHPELAPELLDETIRRLSVMSDLHRRLHDPQAAERSLPTYLHELCSEVLDATGARNVVCLIDAEDVRLDLTKLTALSLMLVELVTNSLKHAFKDRDGGSISISLKQLPGGLVSLNVGDDGPGAATVNNQAASGLGLKIIKGLASQLGADLQLSQAGKPSTRIVFAP